jgi:hypothetical protein
MEEVGGGQEGERGLQRRTVWSPMQNTRTAGSEKAHPARRADRACGCGFVARTHLKSALGVVCSSAPTSEHVQFSGKLVSHQSLASKLVCEEFAEG